MTQDDALAFAREWVAAWNDRDLDQILSHYADTVTFHSPRIALVTGEDTPSLSGKTALKAYWSEALKRAPNLYFELARVFISSDALVISYTNHRDQSVTECFIFNADGEVTTSVAAYA